MKYTVLGGQGFIGQALVKRLLDAGYSVFSPGRDELSGNHPDLFKGQDLGHLIYCIGLTADFRQRPLDTIDAHVCLLNRLLRRGGFLSLTYLSSARLYADADATSEDVRLTAKPYSLDSLYNISKMMGESACLLGSDRARAVRLSNVYGTSPDSGNFLMSILDDAAAKGKVIFRTSPESAKDYVSVSDVVRLLPDIAARGDFGIYNLASGVNTSNKEIADCLKEQGVAVEFPADGPLWTFPVIDIRKISRQFEPPQNRLLEDLPDLLNKVRRAYEQGNRSSQNI
ncbi:MAG: NAD(P)-dependent oxidoreductase [Desulfosalsimonadaceae bacterium]|nr:NAD(P)-dependent oxidoreductase [Desulfosalsimonadaceae bacterium]